MNRIKLMMTAMLAFFGMGLVLMAQDVVAPTVDGVQLPTTVADYWTFGIAAVTPLIISGVKAVLPKIPKGLLPVLTPVVGIGLGLALNALGQADMGWIDMAQAGALAVFVREVVDQNIKKTLAPPPEA